MDTKNAILELRKSLNFSQDEFAEKLMVTRQAVSRWENGDTIPNSDTLKISVIEYLVGEKMCPITLN